MVGTSSCEPAGSTAENAKRLTMGTQAIVVARPEEKNYTLRGGGHGRPVSRPARATQWRGPQVMASRQQQSWARKGAGARTSARSD